MYICGEEFLFYVLWCCSKVELGKIVQFNEGINLAIITSGGKSALGSQVNLFTLYYCALVD